MSRYRNYRCANMLIGLSIETSQPYIRFPPLIGWFTELLFQNKCDNQLFPLKNFDLTNFLELISNEDWYFKFIKYTSKKLIHSYPNSDNLQVWVKWLQKLLKSISIKVSLFSNMLTSDLSPFFKISLF